MNVLGIIAEYNPFHNGHAYQLEQSKKITNADYTVVVMSGDFTQRGEPAIIDKFSRAKMALLSGADLVIELPVVFATGSAEYFANGAVSILNNLGITTHLAFGSECGDMDTLSRIARTLYHETDDYKENLRKNLKSGLSFPTARLQALKEATPGIENAADLLSSPNNILGIEYLIALYRVNSSIQPITIKRIGANYQDLGLNDAYSSALSIRKHIENDLNITLLNDQLPFNTLNILKEEYKKAFPVLLKDFSSMFQYKLIMERKNGYSSFFDINSDFSDRILNLLDTYKDISGFTLNLKTKDKTYSSVSRALLHILLNINRNDIDAFCKNGYSQYARVLGFKKEAAPLLSSIKEKARIPLIIKPSDFLDSTDYLLLKQLNYDLDASCLYQSVVANKFNSIYQNELKRLILKL